MRYRERVGDIVKVKFDEKFHIYARVLNEGSFAFYDIKTADDVEDLNSIVSKPILFITIINSDAVTSGRWPVVGNHPLEEDLKRNPPMFIRDVTDPNKFSIYDNGDTRTATKEECIGLETMASWSPEQIEGRIKDHYEGRENYWAQQYGPLKE